MGLAVVTLALTVLLLSLKTSLNKVNAVFSALLLPLSAINGLCFVLQSDWKATIIFALLCCVCSIVIFAKFAYPPTALKIISAFLSCLLIVLLLFISFIDLTFGDFTSNTVVKSVASPQNTYVVEVIDNNQGALGGATYVNVQSNSKPIDILIGKYAKSPIHVYTGDWGEFENIKIQWKNEHILVINNKEYNISD